MRALTVQIKMFGGFSITNGRQELSSTGSNSPLLWDLLAYLITFRTREIPQAELIDTLWSSADLRNPQSALKVLVHRARAALDEIGLDGKSLLGSRRGAYYWNSVGLDEAVDSDEFNHLCDEADSSRDEDAACELRLRAAKLYDGDFLSNLSSETWVME